MDWQKWLAQVRQDDLFDHYSACLQGKFVNVHEVVEHYAQQGPGGSWTLAPSFFAEQGIENEAHRQLFEAWFAKEYGTRTEEVPARVGSEQHATQDPTLTAWVGSVDWSVGLLSSYRERLKATFRDPQQAVEHYTSDAGNGCLHFDSQQFSRDLGIQEEHRPFFEAWFAEEALAALSDVVGSCPSSDAAGEVATSSTDIGGCPGGEVTTEACEAAASEAPVCGRGDAELVAWMDEVDWSLDILRHHYGEVLRRLFEQPSQVMERYMRESTFDERRFFLDVGVTAAEHQALFRAGLGAQFGLVQDPASLDLASLV